MIKKKMFRTFCLFADPLGLGLDWAVSMGESRQTEKWQDILGIHLF